jgi:signal transduction histidine kinase
MAFLRVYPRAAWEEHARRRSLSLVPRPATGSCLRPASPDLCWQSVSSEERSRPALRIGTLASAALVVVASFALAAAYVVERRRIHADRIHVLRTLTHELRTPATSLRLDIEPLRSAYDELPASCQEPLLRISDGIERLHRVLHRSARYMALFETPGASGERLVKLRDVPSVSAMFEEFAEEWPEGVTLSAGSSDGPARTDPEWLGVAVRNLVENASRHGKAPVAVSWSLVDRSLVVRVSDAGVTRSFSVRRATAPYARDERSPGLGLGLAIVDRVARLLRGKLSHEPSPTVFELRLPIEASS